MRIDQGEDNPKVFVNYKVTTDERFRIEVYNQSTGQIEETLTIRNGNVGVGIDNPGEKLTVAGRICATAMRITANSCWADYVFSKDYKLMPLEQVEKFVTDNHHLPNSPTANEIENNGIDVGEITLNQQEKIEELFLYVIDLHKELQQVKDELYEVKQENKRLRKKKRNKR